MEEALTLPEIHRRLMAPGCPVDKVKWYLSLCNIVARQNGRTARHTQDALHACAAALPEDSRRGAKRILISERNASIAERIAQGRNLPLDFFFASGNIERVVQRTHKGKYKQYGWCAGYTRYLPEEDATELPPISRRMAQLEARKRGRRAVFFTSKDDAIKAAQQTLEQEL